MIDEREGTAKAESGHAVSLGIRVLGLPIALTLAALAWQAWHAYASFRASDDLIAHYVETENFRTLVNALESRKQMSVQIGAEPAQSLWINYYHNSVSSLQDALDRATASTSDHPAAAKILDRVQTLHRAVTDWEARSIRLVLAGDLDGAAKTLFADAYIRDRAEFRESVDAAVHAIREDTNVAMREDQQSEMLSLAISTFLVLLAVIGWISLLMRLRESRVRLSQEVNQRIQAEAQLRRAQKMEAVSRLAGGVAHDFKNVLMIIGGNLKTAVAHLGQRDPALPALKSAREAADHAQLIIRELLALGRRSSVARAPIDARSMIVDTAQLLKNLLPASIEVSVDGNSDGSLWLLADRMQMEQSLVNLALNARDAMPQGGLITFRAFGKRVSGGADLSDRVCIEVIDTGVGMTPEVLNEACEPFFTTRPKEWGSGLGLSIVQNVVTDHGGTLEIASEPGNGTKVTMCLPASVPPFNNPVGLNESDMLGAKSCVIILQTSPYLGQLMAETLRDDGFRLVQVEESDALFDVIAREKNAFSLVIMEVAVLGGDTSEAIQNLRSGNRFLPVIVVTGPLPENAVHDFGEGVVVLCKPFPMAELLRLVRQMAAKWHELRQLCEGNDQRSRFR